MKLLEVSNDQEFIFQGMTFVVGSEGKRCLIVNYSAVLGNCLLIFEGESRKPELVGKERITFGQFKRAFPKFRVYPKGYIDFGE